MIDGPHLPWDGVARWKKWGACPTTLYTFQVSTFQAGDLMKREQDEESVGECLRCRLRNAKRGFLELQIWCVRRDSLAFKTDTLPDWQGCHCSSDSLRGFTGPYFQRRQKLQELFAWIFHTATVHAIKLTDMQVTLGSSSHACTFKCAKQYGSVQWWCKEKKANWFYQHQDWVNSNSQFPSAASNTSNCLLSNWKPFNSC